MSELPPKPDPVAEEPQLQPGGADAIVPEGGDPDPLGRDLPPDLNPATEDLPAEVAEPDDKQQEPEGEADQEAGTERDEDADGPDAGQLDEEGDTEPPA